MNNRKGIKDWDEMRVTNCAIKGDVCGALFHNYILEPYSLDGRNCVLGTDS